LVGTSIEGIEKFGYPVQCRIVRDLRLSRKHSLRPRGVAKLAD
jgi:hypothetical protein